MPPTTRARFCNRCGGTGPFRSANAMRCVNCDAQRLEERREAGKPYHQARYRAWKRLEEAHPEEFEMYKADELAKARRRAKKEKESTRG